MQENFSIFSFLNWNIFAEYFLRKNKIKLDKSGQKPLKSRRKTISYFLKFNNIKVINFVINLNIKIKTWTMQDAWNLFQYLKFKLQLLFLGKINGCWRQHSGSETSKKFECCVDNSTIIKIRRHRSSFLLLWEEFRS